MNDTAVEIVELPAVPLRARRVPRAHSHRVDDYIRHAIVPEVVGRLERLPARRRSRISLGQALKGWLAENATSLPEWFPREEDGGDAASAFTWFADFVMDQTEAVDAVSGWAFSSGWGGRGTDELAPDGLVCLVDGLLRDALENANVVVRLSSPVLEVDYECGSGRAGGACPATVVVAAAEVGAAPEVHEFDRVIVTAPLGVLKASVDLPPAPPPPLLPGHAARYVGQPTGAIRFTPPLPPWKQAAIRRLGVGRSFKLALAWKAAEDGGPPPFWEGFQDGSDVELLGLISGRDGRTGRARRAKPSLGQGEHWEFVNLTPFARKARKTNNVSAVPYVLCGETDAAHAQYLSGLPEAAAVARAMTALRRAFGPHVPDPAFTASRSWTDAEPFQRGALSYWAVGSGPADSAALAEPVAGGALLFAGEAANMHHPQLMVGAYLSGLWAADAAAHILRTGGLEDRGHDWRGENVYQSAGHEDEWDFI